jgi:hypothetical protein
LLALFNRNLIVSFSFSTTDKPIPVSLAASCVTMPEYMIPKRAIALPGLHFGPGPAFSGRVVGERIYGLLLGQDYVQALADKKMHQLRERATGILSTLFRLCLARVATFVALNNTILGWQVVVGDVVEQYRCVMTADEVEELVCVFGDARREYLCRPRHNLSSFAPASELMGLIDQWLDTIGEGDRAPAAAGDQLSSQQTTLVARPAPLENLFAGFRLRDSGGPPPTAASAANASDAWPPPHLPAADARLLSQPRVRELLEGVCWTAKGPMPDLPNDKTDPLRRRLFLGWLAAAHTPRAPDNTFALFAAPVAFMNNKERQGWYHPSGNQSKMFGHVQGFLEYAADAFKGGKKTVLGLFTPIFSTPQEAETIVAAAGAGGSAAQVFNNHGRMRRFGTAVMLRQVERKGVWGVQVAFFCPWDRHDFIKDTWRPREWTLRLWKQRIVDAVDTWSAGVEVPIHEGYTGGSIVVRKDRDHDSVEMCAGWLLRAVTAPKKTIPRDEEDNEWEWEELCFFKRLEHWGSVEEEEGEGGEMEVDTDM